MKHSEPTSLRAGCGPDVILSVQTINVYQEALLVGQKAFDAQDHVSKPLPHIFGSAAYLQDPQAGLGSVATQQDTEASTQSQQSTDLIEQTPARLVSQSVAAPSLPRTADSKSGDKGKTAYQPQNFKAMLEAALQGDVSVAIPEQQQSGDEQHEAPLWKKDPDASAVNGVSHNSGSVSMLRTAEQPAESKSQESVPQVLAWLEQGRGLFDDESDESGS